MSARFSGIPERHQEGSPAASSGILVETVDTADDGSEGSDLDSRLAAVEDAEDTGGESTDQEDLPSGTPGDLSEGDTGEDGTESEGTAASEAEEGEPRAHGVTYQDLGSFVDLSGQDLCRGIYTRRHNRTPVLAVCGATTEGCTKADHRRVDFPRAPAGHYHRFARRGRSGIVDGEMSGPYLTEGDHQTLLQEQDAALTQPLQELTLATEREEAELGLESPREVTMDSEFREERTQELGGRGQVQGSPSTGVSQPQEDLDESMASTSVTATARTPIRRNTQPQDRATGRPERTRPSISPQGLGQGSADAHTTTTWYGVTHPTSHNRVLLEEAHTLTPLLNAGWELAHVFTEFETAVRWRDNNRAETTHPPRAHHLERERERPRNPPPERGTTRAERPFRQRTSRSPSSSAANPVGPHSTRRRMTNPSTGPAPTRDQRELSDSSASNDEDEWEGWETVRESDSLRRRPPAAWTEPNSRKRDTSTKLPLWKRKVHGAGRTPLPIDPTHVLERRSDLVPRNPLDTASTQRHRWAEEARSKNDPGSLFRGR